MDSCELEEFMESPVYRYALDIIEGEIPSTKYVKKACERFIYEINDLQYEESFNYFFNYKKYKKIVKLMKYINIPLNTKVVAASEALFDFQWFILSNVLCWEIKGSEGAYRYENVVIYIPRKNGKTLLTGLISIILMLFGGPSTKYFSIAPDKDLSLIVLNFMKDIIKNSPILKKEFNMVYDQIRLRDSNDTFKVFESLAYSGRFDGRLASAYIADEVGAMKNSDGINSMKSSQVNLESKIGMIISTAYPDTFNPMVGEVEASKMNIDDNFIDERLFSMLYFIENPNEWDTSDYGLLQANPIANDLEVTRNELLKLRSNVLKGTADKSTFLTKHLNIMIDGVGEDDYIKSDVLDKVFIEDDFDWSGKEVYIGLDLSKGEDNTGVVMSYYDEYNDKLYAKGWAFYPLELELEKSKREGVDYRQMTEDGDVIPCDGGIIDYEQVGNFIRNLESEYGVEILTVLSDSWYSGLLAKELTSSLGDDIPITYVKQSKQVVSEALVYIDRLASKGNLYIDSNDYFKRNFLNSKKKVNNGGDYELIKKNKNMKIDLVDALVNTVIEVLSNNYDDSGVYIG